MQPGGGSALAWPGAERCHSLERKLSHLELEGAVVEGAPAVNALPVGQRLDDEVALVVGQQGVRVALHLGRGPCPEASCSCAG